ncbi:hypothetical protein T552_01462 [Pneumocystis carinii B80]|uniref:Small ribosomal subunit protein uS5m n=1 Tax=Pneumocystis carinii (strain B80) TaxID=1408658 RepID=A0A0W4ZKD0_PNEC8|nr:hypothetical protein T552_01462 [Pneumocystis carinii B80]KTW28833.1 hypothetical protein T552_01462 [Pneumocystis carinii B80]
MFIAKIYLSRPALWQCSFESQYFLKKSYFSIFVGLNKNKHISLNKETKEKDVLSEGRLHDYSKLKNQKLRRTQLHIPYVSDFLVRDPVLDKQLNFLENKDEDMSEEGLEGLEGSKESNLASYLPKIESTFLKENEEDPRYLSMITGMSPWDIRKLIQRPLVIRRVVNQTRKGKIPSMYTLAIVGNGSGMIGLGEGKSKVLRTAIKKACLQAIKNMHYIPRYENRTIYGNVKYKFHAVLLELRSRPRGFGIRANHFIHEICRCIGIKDLSAKVRGSRTGMNVVKATLQALKTQVLPEDIARARGKKVVDVMQTYYSKS